MATPNNDTLYAQAFCDVSREPLVVSVPKIDGNRYYGLQLWDPNGDTFAYIGSRTTGREAGDYALVGPDWMGTLPPGVKRIDSPYNGLAIWGRIGVDGPGDLDNALAIQDQLRLTPLSEYGKSDKQVPPDLAFSEARLADPNPQHVTGELEFFVELANSLKHTPPKAQDAVVAEIQPDRLQGWQHDLRRRLPQRAGEGRAHQGGAIRPVYHGRLRPDGRRAGQRLAMEPEVRDHGQRLSVPGDVREMVHRRQCARRSHLHRRPYRRSRAPLDGAKKYQIHFEKGQQPPAKAFWSVSMYNIADGSFVENPIKRYTFGDRTPGAVTNPDGSLDIFIQQDAPSNANERANWLPSPAGGFNLNLRLYVPDDSLQKGTWKPPVVKAVE